MKRFFIDSAVRLLIFFLAFFSIITIAANTALMVFARDVNVRLNAAVPGYLSVKNIFYLPPNVLILRKLTLAETSSAEPAVQAPGTVVSFSVPAIVMKRQILINHIGFSRPRLQPMPLKSFWAVYGDKILEYLRYLPKNDFRLTIRDISWSKQPSLPAQGPALKNKFDLKIRDQDLRVTGSMSQESGLRALIRKIWPDPKHKDDLLLRFVLDGQLQEQGFLINALTIQRENLFSRLWGYFEQNRLTLNGFTLIRTEPAGEPAQDSGQLERETTAQPLTMLQAYSGFGIDFEPDIFILDLDLRARLARSEICLERAEYTLNNTPAQLNGCLSLQEPFESDMVLTLGSGGGRKKPPSSQPENGMEVVIRYYGERQPAGYSHNADVDLDFARGGEADLALEDLKVCIKDFVIRFTAGRNLDFFAPSTKIRFAAFEEEKEVDLKNIQLAFIYRTNRYKVIQLEAPFYGGSVFGRIWLDKTVRPWSLTSVLVFKDLQAHVLEAFLPYFTKVRGHLSSRIALKNKPDWGLKGTMWITQGRLNDLEFFRWLAETFSLPSLHRVGFEELEMDFFVKPRGYGLEDIHLQSPDVDLEGHFHVGGDRFVASMISLSLSRNVLKESPRFTRILRMFEKDVPSLIFDFQLSGPLEAMNFQWLQSTFKERIQQKIPNFIERKIEREIDAILEPVPSTTGMGEDALGEG